MQKLSFENESAQRQFGGKGRGYVNELNTADRLSKSAKSADEHWQAVV